MAFEKKTWTDRVAEFINRRLLTKEDGSTELVTVARSEGTVSTEGDGFTAANMNDLEQRIADEFSALNNAIVEIQKSTSVILYDEVVSSAKTVTLTDDYTNFDYIEVFGDGAYTKIIPSIEKVAYPSQFTSDTNYRTCRITFEGKQATFGTFNKGSSNSSNLSINRIVGHKLK